MKASEAARGARDGLELLLEVHQAGTGNMSPTIMVDFRSANGAKKKGASDAAHVGFLRVTEEQARWFGRHLYRRLRVTFTDDGDAKATATHDGAINQKQLSILGAAETDEERDAIGEGIDADRSRERGGAR